MLKNRRYVVRGYRTGGRDDCARCTRVTDANGKTDTHHCERYVWRIV